MSAFHKHLREDDLKGTKSEFAKKYDKGAQTSGYELMKDGMN